jgi:hypothetical protein
MPEPDVLYHYTSQAGLLGIVASDSIWVTDIYALNDWTEFRHVFNPASMQVLVDAFKSGLPDDIDANAKQMFIERVLAERNFPTLLDIIKADPHVFVDSSQITGGRTTPGKHPEAPAAATSQKVPLSIL